MKKILLLIVAVAAFAFCAAVNAVEFRRATDFETAHDAVCRISVSGARGTAFFIGCYDGDAYFMTNCHVVGNNRTATLDFFNNHGRETIGARIEWRANDGNLPADFSYLIVNADDLKAIDPPYLQLAGRGARPSEGAMIISCGAPDGRFTQSWKGQILEYYNGKTAIFSPPPVPGQSGSPICEFIDGELFVTGILTWLIGEKGRDDSKGGAIPIGNLYKALERRGNVNNVDYHGQDLSPIPPDATECAETVTPTAPCVLMFTQANCPPCVDAKKDVDALRADGVAVYVYDVATERGSEYVARYGITKTPTFLILGDNFAPVEQIEGAGKKDEIKAVLERLAKKEETPVEAQPKPTTNEAVDAPVVDLPALAPIAPVKPDFRTRPAVYESAGDVGIFEESDRRWQNRGKRNGGGDADKGKSDDKSVDDDDAQGGVKPHGKIGEKLTGGAVDAITSKIEKRIDEKVNAMKDKVRETWNAIKYRVVMALLLLVAVGVIVGEGLVVGLRFLWRKAKQKAGEIRAALELLKGGENERNRNE